MRIERENLKNNGKVTSASAVGQALSTGQRRLELPLLPLKLVTCLSSYSTGFALSPRFLDPCRASSPCSLVRLHMYSCELLRSSLFSPARLVRYDTVVLDRHHLSALSQFRPC
jgi:hypothetical protein